MFSPVYISFVFLETKTQLMKQMVKEGVPLPAVILHDAVESRETLNVVCMCMVSALIGSKKGSQ